MKRAQAVMVWAFFLCWVCGLVFSLSLSWESGYGGYGVPIAIGMGLWWLWWGLWYSNLAGFERVKRGLVMDKA